MQDTLAPTSTATETWHAMFASWPSGVPRRGVLLTCLNEAVPFKGFMIKDDILLLERTNVDPLGSRFIVINFEAINSLRFIDPIKESIFTAAGFTGKFAT